MMDSEHILLTKDEERFLISRKLQDFFGRTIYGKKTIESELIEDLLACLEEEIFGNFLDENDEPSPEGLVYEDLMNKILIELDKRDKK